jgi:peroxiredoxin Q/BCP
MLNVGDKAPDFSLPSESGAEVSLKDFKGHRLVLFFFPKADTPG